MSLLRRKATSVTSASGMRSVAHEAAGVGEGAGGAEVAGGGDLRLPGGAGGVEGGVLGQVEAAVGAVRVGLGVVDGRSVLSGEDPAEPVPLDLGQVLDQAGQREPGRRHRRLGGLLVVEALAFHRQGGAVEVEPAFEGGALVGVQRRQRAVDGGHRSIIARARFWRFA